MRSVLIALILLMLACPAEAGVLSALAKPVKKAAKAVKRIVLLPEHLLIAYAEGIAAWWRYEICD